MATNPKKQNKWRWKEKHHADVWTAMKKTLDNEHWSNTYNDVQLTEAIMEQGVFTTDTITREVRMRHEIGNSEERKVLLFAKQYKKGGK